MAAGAGRAAGGALRTSVADFSGGCQCRRGAAAAGPWLGAAAAIICQCLLSMKTRFANHVVYANLTLELYAN